MFRPVGIVVARRAEEAYFFAATLALVDFFAGLAFADLAGLAAFLAGAAFFVAISITPFGKDVGTGSGNPLSLFGTR